MTSSTAPFCLEFDIPSSDLAVEYKHIHHAQTVRYLEMARLELLKQIGFPMDEILKGGLLLVVASLRVDYKRELFSEAVTITCEQFRVDRRSIFVNQRILKRNGKEAVAAQVESMFLELATKRAIKPPADFLEKFLGYPRLS